ncbi:MAG: cysteine-rich CWC family protein [Pyrinomonadaceae bacterium]
MKLKTALGLFSEKYKDASICESCGDEFICGATIKGCWCMNIKVSDQARADMKEKYAKCLCAECLSRYASDTAGQ